MGTTWLRRRLCEDSTPKISGEVAARRRHDGGEPSDEGSGLQDDAGGAVGPGTLEVELNGSPWQDLEPVVGQGRTEDVAAQGFSAGLVVGGDASPSVEVEAAMQGAQ